MTNNTTQQNANKQYYQIINGKLNVADWLASPNFNKRPNGTHINTIVVHNISLPPDEFMQTDSNGQHYVKSFFTNTLNWDAHPYFKTIKGVEVSAHLFIERDGKITQFVNFEDRAWHAGQSCYLGKPAVNDFSIGIEMEGSDLRGFTTEQYEALAKTVIAINQAYPATVKHLTGHSDIAPTRKTDPGDFFDWMKLRKMVNNLKHEND